MHNASANSGIIFVVKRFSVQFIDGISFQKIVSLKSEEIFTDMELTEKKEYKTCFRLHMQIKLLLKCPLS